MDDLISRQAAIDALAKFVPYAICDESTESYTNGLTDAYNLILQLPSAQPERKKGKWIPVTNGRGGFECDECHNYAPSFQDGVEWLSDYCPNCGADMRGDTDETD